MSSYRTVYAVVLGVIALEFVSPIPLFLSFGALYIMIMKPPWFVKFIRQLYFVEQTEEIERIVIECARQHKNCLTVTELAADTHLNLREAESLLLRLEDEGRISSQISESGAIVFDFNELLPGQTTKKELP
ncbi:hypothetical protein ACFL27_15185 [candidate division CSSED10-310 bacterium]|uniref:PCI domain-containing protein n=1 Tax=candidate division CSSED10-310 bacterium TaxID=2855610 RepID=A0ABV6YZB5_UNCC1